MPRWRPPQAASSPYITPDGYRALERELSDLWAKRRVVNDALSAAAKEGDRSENAEYIYRKKEQAGIDRRIRYLQKRMPDLQIVEIVADNTKVFFGAYVELEILDEETGALDKEGIFRIVGADETDAERQFISIDSPLARSLLKKSTDDEATYQTSSGTKTAIILSVRYD